MAVYRNITVEEVDGVIKRTFDGQGTVMANVKNGILIDVTDEHVTTVKVRAPKDYVVTVHEMEVLTIGDDD